MTHPVAVSLEAVDAMSQPITADDVRRRELGAFLRNRRARVRPNHVGLAAGGRRRTPGLRREEVAQLAGVGVTWYTWLEQGRDIRASAQVLDAVARTLMLDSDERDHLFALAGVTEREQVSELDELPSSVQPVLDQLVPIPACVLNARYDILAFNAVYGIMMDDLSAMPREDRNVMWLACTHPVWKSGMGDRDEMLPIMVAQLRGGMADHVAEPAWKALVRRLTDASPEFAALWARHEVRGPENRIKTILSPKVGPVRVQYMNLWFGPRPGTRLVTYTPIDDESRERLVELSAMTGQSGLFAPDARTKSLTS
jgi:transcriptional regulator with XRE-family HTH domain